MTRMILSLCFLLLLFHPKEELLKVTYGPIVSGNIKENTQSSISPMEGLDLVKECYAANFEEIYEKDTKEYYYKLPGAEYYLYFEGQGETEQDYLYHLYEYVLDETETGLGHAVTYGRYSVNRSTGFLTDLTW